MKWHIGRRPLRRGGLGWLGGDHEQLSDTAHQLSVFVHLQVAEYLESLLTKGLFLGIAIDIHSAGVQFR